MNTKVSANCYLKYKYLPKIIFIVHPTETASEKLLLTYIYIYIYIK